MKNLFRVLPVLLFALSLGSCTQDALEDLTSDITNATDELLASSSAPTALMTGLGLQFAGREHRNDTLRGGRCGHPNRMRGDSIGFADLPQAAQDYLIQNSDTALIERIYRVTLPDSTVRYGVRLLSFQHFHFDATGAVQTNPNGAATFEVIAVTALPQAAQDYLTTNGQTSSVVIAVKITKPDGTIVYAVRLSDNTRVSFDSAGAVVAEPRGRGRRGRRGH